MCFARRGTAATRQVLARGVATATWAALSELPAHRPPISISCWRANTVPRRRDGCCHAWTSQLGGLGRRRAGDGRTPPTSQAVPLRVGGGLSGVPAVLEHVPSPWTDDRLPSSRYLRFGWAAARLDDQGQLCWRTGDGGAGGDLRAGGRWVAPRCGTGLVARPPSQPPTPVSSRRRLLGRYVRSWVPPGTMSCRSGPPWATAGRPRWPICAAPWCCRGGGPGGGAAVLAVMLALLPAAVAVSEFLLDRRLSGGGDRFSRRRARSRRMK